MGLLAPGARREGFSDKIRKGDGLTSLEGLAAGNAGLEGKSTEFRLQQAVTKICVQAAPQTLTKWA